MCERLCHIQWQRVNEMTNWRHFHAGDALSSLPFMSLCQNFLKSGQGWRMLFGTVLVLAGCTCLHGQVDPSSEWQSSAEPLVRRPVHSISATGFCRILGYVRSQQETFPNNSGKTLAVLVGDLYREPMFLTRMKLVTKDGLQFGADFMGNSLFKGPEVDPSSLTLDLGLNTSLKVRKDWAKITLRTGGVTWYRQSRLTVWGNQSFNRMSLFDRRPQTAVDKRPWMRYQNYLQKGLVDMGLRYGSRAFQGVFLGMSDLPFALQLKGVVGKSNFNRAFYEGASNFTSGWRLAKTVGSGNSVAYNTLISRSALDSLAVDARSYHLHTLESKATLRGHVMLVEAGWGQYSENMATEAEQGGAVFLDFRSTAKATWPLSLRAYRISPQFVNVTGNFLNSSVLEVFPNVAGIGATVRAPFESPLVGLGTPVNNRQAIELHADGKVLNCQVNLGLGLASEITPTQGGISYFHLVNGETLSRLNLFTQAWGPYNALNSVYRRTFEVASLSDSLSAQGTPFKKRFNTLEAQIKKNGQWRDREWMLMALYRSNTAQRNWVSLHRHLGHALIKQQCIQVDMGVEINPRVVVLGHVGFERVVGNEETAVGDADAPSATSVLWQWLGDSGEARRTMARNQTHRRLGAGLDASLSPGVNLYVRHQWYAYKDPNFVLNQLSGHETMVELKLTF